MKFAVVLCLIMVPLAAPAPHKKNVLVDALLHLIHADHLKALLEDLMDELGSAENEKACESDCGLLVLGQVHSESLGHIGTAACPLVCHSFEELVHHFHIPVPATTLAPGQVPDHPAHPTHPTTP